MVKLLVLADDFTGAIDTGVQFAQQCLPTLVSTKIQHLGHVETEDFSVFVLDTESRHIRPNEAETRVKEAVEWALQKEVPYFYKKTDSTLRGNIGVELASMLDATGASLLVFIPAYPKNGRTTIAGIQYVGGVPVHLSIYSRDLHNPVTSSYVPEIIAAQTRIPVQVLDCSQSVLSEKPQTIGKRIIVFNARTDEDLRCIVTLLRSRRLLRATAGCAGFAEYLPAALGIKEGIVRQFDCPSQLLIVCGSLNPISLEQAEVAARSGFKRFILSPEQLLGKGESKIRSGRLLFERIQRTLAAGSGVILQTARSTEDIQNFELYSWKHGIHPQTVPRLIARAVGDLAGRILRAHGRLTPVVFGGDTAIGIMEVLRFPKVLPIKSLSHGVVLSRLIDDSLDMPLITKAGGFGSPTVIGEIQHLVS